MLQGYEFLEHPMYFYFSGISTANFDTRGHILQKTWVKSTYGEKQPTVLHSAGNPGL